MEKKEAVLRRNLLTDLSDFYNNKQKESSLKSEQEKLKNSIISAMDSLKIKKVSNEELAKTIDEKTESAVIFNVNLIENAKVIYDIDYVQKYAPSAIEKIYTVDSENRKEFKKVLKSFGLNAEQVSELTRVMKKQTKINEKELSHRIDKGEINPDELVQIAHTEVTSRYIKITDSK